MNKDELGQTLKGPGRVITSIRAASSCPSPAIRRTLGAWLLGGLSLFILFPGGAASEAPAPLIERAIVNKEHVDKAIAKEKEFRDQSEVTAPPGTPWYEIRPGKSRVLVVAGHATAQTREGQIKFADSGTGSLAVALNEIAGTPTMFTTYQSPSDPNFYDENDFKASLARMLEEYKPTVVLDLHGSHPHRPYDVDFGVMGGQALLGRPALVEELRAVLEHEGLRNFSRDYFPAAKNQTIAKWVSARGIPCVQLEINVTWLAPTDGNALQAHRFAQLLQGLLRFIQREDGSLPRAARSTPDESPSTTVTHDRARLVKTVVTENVFKPNGGDKVVPEAHATAPTIHLTEMDTPELHHRASRPGHEKNPLGVGWQTERSH